MSAGDMFATSQEIRDRGSTFVGCIHRTGSVEDAREFVRRRRHKRRQRHAGTDIYVHADTDGHGEASYTDKRDEKVSARDVDENGGNVYAIAAWRVMVVKPSRTGLGGPDDFEVCEGWDDGGERWAGKRVLEVMQRERVTDAVVVVHRWFGGTLLGPIRFTHVEVCASEVCRRFKKVEEMDECLETLHRLDDSLENLRARLAMSRDPNSGPSPSLGKKRKAPDYRTVQETLDFTKAKRLIRARECEIENIKALLVKYSESK